jgi:hypothetical protein
MSPTRRIAAIVALGALALSACSSNDADGGDVVEALTDAEIPQDQADCVGQGFEAEFSQGQLNDLASASNPDEYPDGTQETVSSILDDCLGGGAGPTVDDEGGEDEGSGTTDDTTDGTAEDATTTTGG